MFCKDCGHKINDKSKFCKNCGIKIDSEIEENKKSVTEKNNEKIIRLIVLLGFILFIYYAFFNNHLILNNQATNNSSNQSATGSENSQQSLQTNSQKPNLNLNSSSGLSTALINKIESVIVEINCYSSNNDIVMGSGMAYKESGNIYISTNYHVYNMAINGKTLPVCYAVFPDPPNYYYNINYGDYNISLVSHNYDVTTYEDSAIFLLGQPYNSQSKLDSIPTITDLSLASCSSNVNVGDKLHIFGYPSSGNALGISETVTQGSIAGILSGPIYKTDAPIDHGNSGGLAVLDKNTCLLGIPTLGQSGLTAGIGYIQSFNLAKQPVQETNDQICQDNYGVYSNWSGQKNKQWWFNLCL